MCCDRLTRTPNRAEITYCRVCPRLSLPLQNVQTAQKASFTPATRRATFYSRNHRPGQRQAEGPLNRPSSVFVSLHLRRKIDKLKLLWRAKPRERIVRGNWC